MKYLLIIGCLLLSIGVKAQVGIGTNSPNSSAALEISDTTRGLLIPRMNMTRRNTIANPAVGLLIYQLDNTPGYYYYDGVSWRNVNTTGSSVNGGKQTVVLSDDITDLQAQTVILNDFGPNTQELKIIGCTNLTSVDLSIFTTAIKVEILNNEVLQSVNLHNLTRCDGDLHIENCPLLTTVNLSSLAKVLGDFTCYKNAISAINFPLLTKAGAIFLGNSASLTSVSFPLLNSCTYFYLVESNVSSISSPSLMKADRLFISRNLVLSSISFPVLSTVGDITVSYSNAITSLTFPALTAFTNNSATEFSNCPNLSSISFDNLAVFKNFLFGVNYNKLPSSQINYLLNKLVSINPAITGKTLGFSGQNPAAPPTGTGIIAKSTLMSNGNSVSTD